MYLCSTFLLIASLIVESLTYTHPIPPGWTLHRRADPDTKLLVRLSLVQPNLHNLDAYLLDIADPQSPNYGQHWTPERVKETFRPSQGSADVVRSWLVSNLDAESSTIIQTDEVLSLNISVAQAERIFTTNYNVYRANNGFERVGCHQGHNFPAHVAEHVEFVWPSLTYGGPRLTRRNSPPTVKGARGPRIVQPSAIDVKHCDDAVTLDCLRALYNFHYDLVAAKRNTVGVAEFGMQYYNPADLDMFFKRFAPDQVGNQPKLISIAGGQLNESDPNLDDFVESSLDLELMMGLLGRKQEVFLYEAGTMEQDPLSDELLGAWDAYYCSVADTSGIGRIARDSASSDCGDAPRANVVSISYTSTPDVRDSTFLPMLQRECTEIGKLALMGVTVIASSGDFGVAFPEFPDTLCLVNDKLEMQAPNSTQSADFVAAFPASCPYVTAVGSTQVSPGKSVRDPETATFAFPSGGGFSNAFVRPRFQNAAVTNYLKHFALPYGPSVFNRSGRAYPDVSANGCVWPTVVAVAGNFNLTGGTSASAPIFASLITAVNDARIAIGKKPVGWINPALYSPWFVGSFNDVTNGTNPGCGTEGFRASPGWDPVTGLGTPNFERLLANFLLLP
ncbi:subtilisin-like protein [Dichomitus squalens LYAD-421 SS1]|uniref:subtilisin-like protein n=1 Tax=Dichomitus squalens (strain LYAD-421) TaxID=732165 RepID=UPI0004411985|nr:subtilisin-like protein [Dichomitus squalens LYAD-421 SS1]EJF64895.1 subtilisin-like protein [Dichomitus squalens LYAD-421 SS1]